MQGITEFLGHTRVVQCLLMALVLLTLSFGVAAPATGGTLLDMQMTAADGLARLAAMDAAQRTAHLGITLTLDMLYPFVYGGALAGIAAHFAQRHPTSAAAPALMLIAIDLAENMLIVGTLMGQPHLIYAKTLATQVKWGFFALASLIAITLSLGALVRRLAMPHPAPGG